MVTLLVLQLERAATILPLVAVPPTPMGVKAHWRLVFFGSYSGRLAQRLAKAPQITSWSG